MSPAAVMTSPGIIASSLRSRRRPGRRRRAAQAAPASPRPGRATSGRSRAPAAMPTACSSAVATAKPAIYSRPPAFSGTSRAMGMAMEQGEQADDGDAGRDRQVDRQARPAGRAQRPRRGCPARRTAAARAACRAAPPASITPTKASGHAQIALPALERGPQADRDHHGHVVEADSGCAKPAVKDESCRRRHAPRRAGRRPAAGRRARDAS